MIWNVGLGRFSTGSPSSSTFEQISGGKSGNCHEGTRLVYEGIVEGIRDFVAHLPQRHFFFLVEHALHFGFLGSVTIYNCLQILYLK